MGKRSILFALALLLAPAWGEMSLLPASAPQESTTGGQPQTVAQKCLACHGSYDKLAEKTAGYTAASGETVTPHQYVPHQDKKDIPECTECHIVQHPVPLKDKSEVVKPNDLGWCYASCHHAANLQPCKNCH